MIDGIAHGELEVTRCGPLDHAIVGSVALYLTPQQTKGHEHCSANQGHHKSSAGLTQTVSRLIEGDQAYPEQRGPNQWQDGNQPGVLI